MKSPDEDVLEKLCRRFADTSGGAIQIRATPEQKEQLGEFLLKGVFGWALGIFEDERPAGPPPESHDDSTVVDLKRYQSKRSGR